MFKPKYRVSPRLLRNIKQISILVAELNNESFADTAVYEIANKAAELSAYSSTSIEGNPLPLTDVKILLKNHPKNLRDTEREVVNYNEALEWIKKQRKKYNLIDMSLVLKLHKLVMGKLMPSKKLGKFRMEPVFVNDPKMGKTIYWPPDHQDCICLMRELVAFCEKNYKEMDAIILAGVFHKQFVIIHPFVDGNGRTTRLLTSHLLANLGLDTFDLFSFENYYNKNVTKYFKKVGVRGNYYEEDVDFTEWLEYFSDGILDELLRVKKELEAIVIDPSTVLNQDQEKILKYIAKHGYINDKIYSDLTERAKATRSLDFKKLMNLKLISRHGRARGIYYKLVS